MMIEDEVTAAILNIKQKFDHIYIRVPQTAYGYFANELRSTLTQRDEATQRADRLQAELDALREQKPVAWRERGRSEPEMIGNYPWSYREKALKPSIYDSVYETQPLYTAPPAQQMSQEDLISLVKALRGGRRCDEYGVEIIMSRQACCEAADILAHGITTPQEPK